MIKFRSWLGNKLFKLAKRVSPNRERPIGLKAKQIAKAKDKIAKKKK